MKITVAICTWNRAKLLDQTLAEMGKLKIPAGVGWELLVINNNCTDNTDEVIARYEKSLPIRGILERKQGHSNARNRAVAEAGGELLIWTDDDVLVSPQWIEEYVKAVELFPDAGYFGGTVDPLFEVEPPHWVSENLDLFQYAFALRQLGGEVRPLEKDELVFGANMAFRLGRVGKLAFNPQLGRIGTGMLSGDETEVLMKLKAQGIQGIWIGTAGVRHFVPKERLRTKYVWNYLAGIGAVAARDEELPPGTYWFNRPRWRLKQYFQLRLEVLRRSLHKDKKWAALFYKAAIEWGRLGEFARRRETPA